MADGSDEAAIAAVESFYSTDGRADAVDAELGSDAPLYTEGQQQQDELIEAGVLDIDGNTIDKSKQPTQTEQKTLVPVVGKQEAAPTLDANLRLAAKEFGWTDDKIERLMKADPELAAETFGSFADTLADRARDLMGFTPGNSPAVNQQVAAPIGTASQPVIPPALSDEALKKFGEENGEQAATLMKQMRDHFAGQLAEIGQRAHAAEQQQAAQLQQNIASEAKSAFGSLSKSHASLYGDGTDNMTVGQNNRRMELGRYADQIRAGAAAQGRQMTVTEAINAAHYVISRDTVKADARKEVAAQVQKRAGSAVAKPTQRVNPRAAGQGRSDENAMSAAAMKMAEIGLDASSD